MYGKDTRELVGKREVGGDAPGRGEDTKGSCVFGGGRVRTGNSKERK